MSACDLWHVALFMSVSQPGACYFHVKFNCDTVLSEDVLAGMLPMTVCGMLPLFVVQRGNVLYKGSCPSNGVFPSL